MDGQALPRYVQIAEMLIRDIGAGRLADGVRLPPERAMAEQLDVSVGTLRKALDRLAEAGLLDRVQGSGNYVRARQAGRAVYAFFRLERPDGGGLPTAEVLSVDRVAKPATLPEFGESAEAHRIRRLRRLDGVPVALEEIWLDGARAEVLSPAALSESLYLHYREALDLVIGRVEDRVGIGKAPRWGPAGIGPAAGETCGQVDRLSWSQDGERVEASATWFDNEKCRYVSRMGRG
ncbi:GntR family transcriptional regulator [Roseisalinus antarcticus]|uniref:HTH-type transcriptional repressor YvoA n=1 Tax=Roseisalinus antarcticus TaxID=254357 RepID=A0A1Y5RLQ5_9RHOB|nr:GntR family transcriptional regulator [Roseisalinus antarcticus]SLN20282.1 HTH-type transcriptional repressor YvoA [Roseisalinus antarcticus]